MCGWWSLMWRQIVVSSCHPIFLWILEGSWLCESQMQSLNRCKAIWIKRNNKYLNVIWKYTLSIEHVCIIFPLVYVTIANNMFDITVQWHTIHGHHHLIFYYNSLLLLSSNILYIHMQLQCTKKSNNTRKKSNTDLHFLQRCPRMFVFFFLSTATTCSRLNTCQT